MSSDNDSAANRMQVGGGHYKTAYEPWDFGIRYALPNLEFTAMVYVARARKKNGAEDYRKAVHYVDKIVESYEAKLISPPFVMRRMAAILRELHFGPSLPEIIDFSEFAQANELTLQEDVAIRGLCDWKNVAELEVVRSILVDLADGTL